MTQLPFLDATELARLVPMEAAVHALEDAFGAETGPQTPQRTHVPAGGGELLIMPAAGDRGTGVKLVTVNPANPERGLPLIHGLYVLFEAGSLAPVAAIDGAALTSLRTAAVSALATKHLARPEAAHLAIFGAGAQARAHLEAMPAVRPVDRVTVVSRTRERAERLATRASDLGHRAEVGAPDAVGEAELVCTCTTSPTPVFDGSLLEPGTHINAVGAYRPDARELDDETIRRGRLVVETREAALAEAGDLLLPIEAGVIGTEAIVADLSEVVHGAPVRTSPEDVTVFKSVGVAFEDLAVASAAVQRS